MSEFEGWAIVELMGHRQRPGYVREVELAGAKMLRIDIPAESGDVTEYYGASAIYAIRPAQEEIVRDRCRGFGAQRPVRPLSYQDRQEIEFVEEDEDHG